MECFVVTFLKMMPEVHKLGLGAPKATAARVKERAGELKRRKLDEGVTRQKKSLQLMMLPGTECERQGHSSGMGCRGEVAGPECK